MIREDAIVILNDIQDNLEETSFLKRCAIDMGIKALEEQRPHGKWIIVDDCEHFIAKCSVCGRIEDSRLVKHYSFCRCGADMRDKKDDLATIIEAAQSMKNRGEAE